MTQTDICNVGLGQRQFIELHVDLQDSVLDKSRSAVRRGGAANRLFLSRIFGRIVRRGPFPA
jgi:hypothetical protein